MAFPPTDWLDWTTAEYDVGSPATSLSFERWFRNPVALAQGAAGAPKIFRPALSSAAGLSATFIDLDDFGGFEFDLAIYGAASYPLTFAFSVDNGTTWSTAYNLLLALNTGNHSLAGWFDFNSGNIGFVAAKVGADPVGKNDTVSGASLAINAIKFASNRSMAATIYPNGGSGL